MFLSKIYVITGSIGCGKSTICNYLIQEGYSVIDADKIAHKMLDRHYDSIVAMFGEVYTPEGVVDRKKLGAVVFSDSKKLKQLENFIHPLIQEEVFAQVENLKTSHSAKDDLIFIDIPLFFETNSYDFENTIVIYAPKETLAKRVSNRDKITIELAYSKIALQMDIEEKKAISKYVIDNSGTTQHALEQLNKLLERIKL